MRYSYQSTENTPVWVLIGANLFVFIATLIIAGLDERLALALSTLPQEPWTLVTSMFVHAGFWHIFSNMLMLFFFGTFLAQLIGGKKVLWVYLIGGIVGNLVFLLFSYLGIGANAYTAVVGASGAIFALGGTLAILRPRLPVYIFGLIPIPLWVYIILGLVLVSPGVAWQAHLGGLVTGLLAGLYFRKQFISYRIR